MHGQVESGKAAKLVAKVLQQCHRELDSSDEAVKALWMQARLNWDALGMRSEDLAEFLVDQVRTLCSLHPYGSVLHTHAHTYIHTYIHVQHTCSVWATSVRRQKRRQKRHQNT